MDEDHKHHGRRSHHNTQLFSVRPLTSIPLGIDSDVDVDEVPRISKSYLASRSLPQTPSILSRSNSPSRSTQRLSSKSSHAISGLTDTAVHPPERSRPRHHNRSRSARSNVSDNRDWLVQTASALATSTAESKGQAWLAARSSSTSLVKATYELPESAYRADEFSPVFMWHTSRPHSRFGSRLGSRRGSKVSLVTPLGLRTPGERDEQAGYFSDHMEVDFVESDNDSTGASEDENEMKRLVLGRARGWVDWALGWMDFRGDKNDVLERSPPVSGVPRNPEPGISRKSRRSQEESDSNLQESVGAINVPPAPQESGGVLTDASWLLGVAKSSLGLQ